jgi:hypothetical protein
VLHRHGASNVYDHRVLHRRDSIVEFRNGPSYVHPAGLYYHGHCLHGLRDVPNRDDDCPLRIKRIGWSSWSRTEWSSRRPSQHRQWRASAHGGFRRFSGRCSSSWRTTHGRRHDNYHDGLPRNGRLPSLDNGHCAGHKHVDNVSIHGRCTSCPNRDDGESAGWRSRCCWCYSNMRITTNMSLFATVWYVRIRLGVAKRILIELQAFPGGS